MDSRVEEGECLGLEGILLVVSQPKGGWKVFHKWFG